MLQDIKSVLIGVTAELGEEEPSSAVSYGLSLAREAHSHATVQAAALMLEPPAAWVAAPFRAMLDEQNLIIRARAEAIAANAAREAEAAGVSCTTHAQHLAYSDLLASFRRMARLHDLTILDAEPEALKADRGLFETLLLETGRPVLVAPPQARAFRLTRVAVAWDGSARAARAAHDALPFLRAAEAVEIVTVTGEKDLAGAATGADLSPHFARHGVDVAVTSLAARGGDVAEALRRHALETKADMIVMGGYAQSRFREMVFGGVTQSLLEACPVALFMAY